MIKLNSLTKDDIQKIYNNSKELKELTNERVQENCMFFINEKLDIIKPYLKNWSIGLFEKCFIDFKDCVEVLEVLNTYEKTFGLHEDTKDLKSFISNEILSEIKYTEDLIYKDDLFNEFYEFILDTLDNYYYTESKLIKLMEVK